MVVAGAVPVHLVHLRLHLLPLPVAAHEGRVDFVVKVADIAHHRTAFQCLEHIGVAHVEVAGSGDHQVDVAQQPGVDAGFGAVVVTVQKGRNHLVAVHAGLHGADRVDLGDPHYHAFLPQGLGRTLADVAVADNQRFLAGQQVIGAALDGIVQAVATAVLVVVLRLGDRVVDVDRGYFERALLEHLQQAMHPGGGLLGDAVNIVQHGGVFLVQHTGEVAAVIQHHVGVPGRAVLEDGLLQAPVVLFLGLAFPGEYRHAGGGDRGGGVVLGREYVTGRPAHFGAEFDQGFDQHAGLDGHVDTTQYLGPRQRLAVPVLGAHRHQRGHLTLGDVQFPAAPVGQGDIGDFVVLFGLYFLGCAHIGFLALSSIVCVGRNCVLFCSFLRRQARIEWEFRCQRR